MKSGEMDGTHLALLREITCPNVHLHTYPLYTPSLCLIYIPTSNSSASTSPLLLTPESTGASGSQLAIVIDSPIQVPTSSTDEAVIQEWVSAE
jgi:hypothetical protein